SVNTGLTNRDVTTLALDPLTPATLYVGTSSGGGNSLFKSTDGGSRWSAINTGFPYRIDDSGRYFYPYVWTLAIDPQTPATLYAGTEDFGGGVYKGTNGEGSCSAVNSGLINNCVMAAFDLDRQPTAVPDQGTRHGGL